MAVVAAVVAWTYLGAARQSGIPFYFYQDEFGPAVMAACGRGLVNPLPRPSSPLVAFLTQNAASLDCAQLEPALPHAEFDAQQQMTRYLLLASAGLWRITGMSWRSLDALAAVFAAVTMALGYLVFRLVLPRWLAIALSLVWLTSPLHLFHLTSLRDYAKAPFFVLTVLILAALIVRPFRARRLVIASAFLGAGLGIGVGFRTDVAINLVPFAVSVALFLPGGLWRNLAMKATALAACLAAFVLCAWPLIRFYQSGNTFWHVSLLGLTDPFNNSLGISPSIYSFGNSYSDSLIEATVTSYAERTQPEVPPPQLFTPGYESASRRYYLSLLRTFPADFVTRALGSIIKTLNLPFSVTYGRTPLGVMNPLLERVYDTRAWCLTALEGITPALLCGLLAGLVVHRPRFAVALAVLVVFFTAYPMLQYYGRHVFHLEMVPLWVDTLCVWMLVQYWPDVRALLRRDTCGYVVCAAAFLGAVMFVPLLLVRHYQIPRVQELVTTYLRTPSAPVTIDISVMSTGAVRFSPRLVQDGGLHLWPVTAEMLRVDVGGARCPSRGNVDVTVQYVQMDASPRTDFSHIVHLAIPTSPQERSTAFVPVYWFSPGTRIRFAGIDVPRDLAPCIAVIRQMGDLRRFPLLLEVTLTPGTDQRRLYQRLGDIEVLPPHVRSLMRRLGSL